MSVPEHVDEIAHHPAVAADSRSAWAAPADPDGGSVLADADVTLVQQLFASHPLPMLIYDVERLEIVEVNNALLATYGYSRDELLAMPVARLLPPEDVPRLLDVIQTVVRPGRAPYRPPSRWRHVYKDGRIRDVEVAVHDCLVRGREAVLAIVTDITERLEAERERDALLDRLSSEAADKAAILEQMIDAVLVSDSEGRIRMANAAAHDLFEVAGPEWPRLGHGDPPCTTLPWNMFDALGNEIAPSGRPFARAMRGETVRAEVRIVTASGRERWVSASASPFHDAQGRKLGVVWIGREITEERGRREREAQGEKLRALGQLASGVAHDLNQYLGLVAGYGDLATRALDGPAPDLSATRDALDVVVRAAMDGSDAVKRLLSFARPAQDGPADAVDVGGLLREVAALTAPRWRGDAQQHGKPISLIVEIVGDTTVRGWAASLREAITNLIFNAVDALPEGGTIRLGAHQEEDRVLVTITDSGVGIPPEALARVFEPFFTTKGERGTGLGLAIVYGIVERHQGTVSISSPPGQGTTVTLALPTGSVAPAPVPKRPELSTPTGLRILVVDDEPAITRMVAMMLGPYGHDVTIATSGEEALACIQGAAAPFDLILSDLGLGAGINGWELLDRVRECAPDSRFILSTGWGAQIDPSDVAARGGEGLLAKPYRLSDLLEAVAGPT
jgi:PAS domain S-box-containing protein